MNSIVKEPVYLQICHVLKELIDKGEFSRGSRFLSEREVSARFEVSRTTANKALSSLVGEGILSYKKGVGTFVSEGSTKVSIDIQEFLKHTPHMSYDIKVFCERAFKDLPDSIQNVFSEAHPVYYIMTVYSLTGSPVIINRKYINTPDSLKSGEKFIKNDYFEYSLVKKEINLSRLKKNDAPLMKMNEGDTLYLVRDELVKDDSVIYDVSLLKSEDISFIMDLDGIMKISHQGEI